MITFPSLWFPSLVLLENVKMIVFLSLILLALYGCVCMGVLLRIYVIRRDPHQSRCFEIFTIPFSIFFSFPRAFDIGSFEPLSPPENYLGLVSALQ